MELSKVIEFILVKTTSKATNWFVIYYGVLLILSLITTLQRGQLCRRMKYMLTSWIDIMPFMILYYIEWEEIRIITCLIIIITTTTYSRILSLFNLNKTGFLSFILEVTIFTIPMLILYFQFKIHGKLIKCFIESILLLLIYTLHIWINQFQDQDQNKMMIHYHGSGESAHWRLRAGKFGYHLRFWNNGDLLSGTKGKDGDVIIEKIDEKEMLKYNNMPLYIPLIGNYGVIGECHKTKSECDAISEKFQETINSLPESLKYNTIFSSCQEAAIELAHQFGESMLFQSDSKNLLKTCLIIVIITFIVNFDINKLVDEL